MLDELHKDRRWKGRLKGVYDTAQGEFELRFFRTQEKKEIDFVVPREGKPWLLVDCKSQSRTPSLTLVQYARVFKTKYNNQLVRETGPRRDHPATGVSVRDYETFFSGWC